MRLPKQVAMLGFAILLRWSDDLEEFDEAWKAQNERIKLPRAALASNSAGTVIYIIPFQNAEEKAYRSAKRKRAVAQFFKFWSEFDPSSEYRVEIPDNIKFSKAGEALAIAYESDKYDGALAAYRHDFKLYPDVWVDDPDDPQIFAIKYPTKGRKIANSRGIVG